MLVCATCGWREGMTYEEFEDRHGAETTGDRRAVWIAGFEEAKRQMLESYCRGKYLSLLKAIDELKS